MANADPAGVGSHVRNRDAAQVSADSTADQHVGVVVWQETDGRLLVRKLGWINSVTFSLLFLGESSDEHWSSVPDDLEDFT